MSSTWMPTILVLLMGALTPTTYAAVHALIVGINDYGAQDNNLSSCLEDARSMARLLESSYGVPRQNIRLLMDSQATREGIETAFRETLIRGVRPDDEVFFYFSGHGTLLPNLTSIASHRAERAMVPFGIPRPPLAWEKVLSFAQLDAWLAESPAGRHTVVLDCCHSGALTRSLRSDPTHRPKVLDLGFGAAENSILKDIGASPRASSKSLGRKTVLWLGACESRQVAYCGRTNSLFTGRLLQALQAKPNASIATLHPEVSKAVRSTSTGFPQGQQNPQSEGAIDQPLLLTAARLAAPITGSTQPAPGNGSQTQATAAALSKPPTLSGLETPLVVNQRTGETLLPSSSIDGKFRVEVRMDKDQYVTNDLAVLNIRSSEDAFIRVFVIAADASHTQIFPNLHHQANQVKKGEILRLPPSTNSAFALRITEPLGTEIVWVQARRNQFPDLAKGLDYGDGYVDLSSESPAQSRSRGMRVEGVSSMTEARVSYQVVPTSP
jgi:metacaspase-1